MRNEGAVLPKQTVQGHLAAALTILIWGTTFISTKVLLRDFAPVEILFFRFCIGFLALSAICPRRLRAAGWKQERYFLFAGLTGVTLYFLLENIALTFSPASNVGVIISVAPFFTALLAHFFLNGEPLRGGFFLGFAVALAGVALISFNGAAVLRLNPLGDLLALLAALVWAVYAVLTRRIAAFGFPTVQATRRVFFYGLLFMLPALFFTDFRWGFARFANPRLLLNILYLGLGASALCFVTWNLAVRRLGAVRTSVYIYCVPVITVATSVIVLRERITPLAAAGVLLTLAGLVLSLIHISEPTRPETDKNASL